MNVNKEKLQDIVNQTMARMFFLLPDVDDHGRQLDVGPEPERGKIIQLQAGTDQILQFVYEDSLLTLMTSNITALPPDEVPLDWSRQIPLEATKVCWGRYLTIHDKNYSIPFNKPYQANQKVDITGAHWQFNYISESHQLSVSLIETANL